MHLGRGAAVLAMQLRGCLARGREEDFLTSPKSPASCAIRSLQQFRRQFIGKVE